MLHQKMLQKMFFKKNPDDDTASLKIKKWWTFFLKKKSNVQLWGSIYHSEMVRTTWNWCKMWIIIFLIEMQKTRTLHHTGQIFLKGSWHQKIYQNSYESFSQWCLDLTLGVKTFKAFLAKEYFNFSHNNYRSFFLLCFPYFLFLYPQALQTLCLGYMLDGKYFPCNWAAWRFGFLPCCTMSSPLAFCIMEWLN